MTTNNALKMACAGSLLAITGAANALVAVDGWQIDTANAPTINSTLTTNIGHLNLSGGVATVNQEISGGTPFVGARFTEFGQIFTVTFTPESVIGLGDSGVPDLFNGGLRMSLEFSGLAGSVDSYNSTTGEIKYSFAPGVGTIGLYGTTNNFASKDLLASFDLISPSGGDLSNFFGIGNQSQGQSTISALVLSSVTDLFRNSLGASFDPLIASGGLYALVVTTNKISAPGFLPSGPCGFDPTAQCVTGSITSDGSFDLLTVPEPGVLSLMGLGILGMARMFRNTRKI